MSKSTTAIIVLAAILLLSIVVNYYQFRVQVLTERHYAQGHTLDSLQITVYQQGIDVLMAKTAELQKAYLDTKNRYLATKLANTNTDNLSDQQLSDILKQKLTPMGGP